MNARDIVLAPFPYTDLRNHKIRPALVISHKDLGEDVVIMGITTQKLGRPSREVSLSTQDLSLGELPQKCFVRCGKMVTVHKSILGRCVGQISVSKWQEVCEKTGRLVL